MAKPIKNLLQMLDMRLQGRAEYQYIIKEDNNELSQCRSKGGIHGTLEGTWCACEPKRHHSELILAEVCLERCFELLPFTQQNLMEASP